MTHGGLYGKIFLPMQMKRSVHRRGEIGNGEQEHYYFHNNNNWAHFNRLRNKDRQFTKIEVNGKLSNILLFPVAIYGETTIMSMIICISCEILFVLSMFLMYVLKVDKLFVCFFWGVFQIFFIFIGAGVESLAECKIQEKKGQKIFWFLFGIIMIVAPTIWMVSQIREFLEVI